MAFNFRNPAQIISSDIARRGAMVGGTFAVAMGIGFFMQQEDASAARMQAPADVIATAAAQIAPVLAPVAAAASSSGAPALVTPAPVTPVKQARPQPVLAQPALPGELEAEVRVAAKEAEAEAPLAASSDDCAPQLDALPAAAAMVDLILKAPCNPNERVTIHHEGMMFTTVTDEVGSANLRTPALSETAVFIAALTDGGSVLAQVRVASLAFYDRVVLQWQGETGLQVHALEFGASYGEDGHVWSDAARSVDVGARGEGGFLVRLGTLDTQSPRVAEVYTFPSGMIDREGSIALSVEAEISAQNCDQQIDAQTLQYTPEGGLKIGDLTLTIPDCESIGQFLVLRDLYQDVVLAAGQG